MRGKALVVLALGGALLVAEAGQAAAQRRGLSTEVRAQIESLMLEKRSRTPSQRKLSSRLIQAARMRRGQPITTRVSHLRTGVIVAADGTTLIDVEGAITPPLLARIRQLRGSVVNAYPRRGALRARLPLDAVETLAVLPAVRRIRPAGRAMTRKIDTSEGDVAHRADVTRAVHDADGTGIAIGVLSDGVDSLVARQGTGDLPPTVTVLPGQKGSGDEGTAMLEIVHDLAPGAELLFATAFGGQASFASNIIALRDAGADVIVDDVAYFAESVFQDDDVADAVDTVYADGAMYFSAAGNEGNLDDGTSGVWEGDWSFSGTLVNMAPAHDFGGGEFANEITSDSPFAFTLHWSDPNDGSGNDYDLLLVDPDVEVLLAASTDVQDGDDDPFEIIDSDAFNDTGNKLIIVQNSGAARYLHLNTQRGELDIATSGQISGHAAARGAVAVAAVDARFAGGAGGVFDGTESVQTYSSDGPRRIFYDADGTAFTPADLSGSGGEERQKPRLAGADCVDTSTPGFNRFCGTSAAAPHLAAIAALLFDIGSEKGVTVEEVMGALQSTTLDIEAPGIDRDSGAGIVDAFAASETSALLVPSLGPGGLALVLLGLIAIGCTSLRARNRPRP